MKITSEVARRWLLKKVKSVYASLRKQITAYIPFKPSKVLLAAATDGLPDYFVWGVIDWHFRHQRPQQLSKALVDSGRRVFYISSNFRNDRRAGFAIEPLDNAGKLFQIKLFLASPKVIYFSTPSTTEVEQLQKSIGQLICWANTNLIISFVQHAFWCDIARSIPNSRLVYDCIDHHEGFGNNAVDIIFKENQLLREAEITVTTSEWLDSHVADRANNRHLIRNATDFSHFAAHPKSPYIDPENRKIIGYYGAIASWFDTDLIGAVATNFPDCCILLIGADTVNAKLILSKHQNIIFTGEVEYKYLPNYLHSFDVCLLPFKILPLTLATNPVKVYEYLSAGKPVVSVDLPEMINFNGLVNSARSKEEFVLAISNVLSTDCSPAMTAARIAFAKEQTWTHRAANLIACAELAYFEPKISVIVVTYNNLSYTIDCLASVVANSQYNALEIIVVDNASVDGTTEYLQSWAHESPNRAVILNNKNAGFAAANNQGLAIAKGEFFVLLNNDTFVTPGWVRTLHNHLKRDSSIGLIGPVTNNIGNEAKIVLAYKNMDQMVSAAKKYTSAHINKISDIATTAFFCVMFSRDLYNNIGQLDESYGLGFFEDDDYCRRVEFAGLRIVCTDDVFVHHQLSASFLKLPSQIRRNLFLKNKVIYESKWGTWKPHQFRKSLGKRS